MQPDWIMGLLGGLIIGLAGAVYLLGNGRIMGASGIIGGAVDGSDRTAERLTFLAGLFGARALLALGVGGPDTRVTSDIGVVVAAGLVVGSRRSSRCVCCRRTLRASARRRARPPVEAGDPVLCDPVRRRNSLRATPARAD